MNNFLKIKNVSFIRSFSCTPIFRNAVPPKMKPKKLIGPITWKSVAVTAVVAGGFTGFMLYLRKEKQEALERDRKRQLGKSKIGGSFELIDSEVSVHIQ